MQFGGPISGQSPYGSVLKPEEAWNIDTKMDDGKPATGKVVMYGNGTLAACSDATVSTTLTANYRLSSSSIACALMFRQLF